MSLKDLFKSSARKGIMCERSQDGAQQCTRFEVVDGQRVATGTTINLNIDPSTCQVTMGGDVNSIMDDEYEDLNKVKKGMEVGCRRGIA
mgnify:FL=1